MSAPRTPLWLVASSLVLGACASAKADGPREAMGELVHERTGIEDALSVKQDEDARAQVQGRIDALLGEKLSRDGALELALLNNPGLAAQLEGLGLAQAELVNAGLLENPSLGGNLSVSTLGNGFGGGFGLGQSLLSAVLIPAKRKLAKARLEQTILSLGRSAAELAEEVKVAYVEAQRAAADLALHKQALQSAEVLDELAQKQFDAGNIPEGERAHAGARLDGARLEFGHARMVSMMARERLHRLFGVWGAQLDWQLPGRIDAPPAELPSLDGLMERALRDRLDLSAARVDVEVAMRAIKLRRAGVIPQIEVGVEGGNEVGNDIGHEWVIGPSLSIELPIFNPGHGDFAALRAHLRAAQHLLQAQAVQVRSDVRLHRQHLVYAHQKLVYVRDEVLPRQELILKRTVERFNAMLIGAEELFEAKDELRQAKRAKLDALTDFWVASAELELAIGGRL